MIKSNILVIIHFLTLLYTLRMKRLQNTLNELNYSYNQSKSLLHEIDVLLEAQKQLSLAAVPETSTSTSTSTSTNTNTNILVDTEDLDDRLKQVKEKIEHLKSLETAKKFISTCSIPSVASSPIFISSLTLILTTSTTCQESKLINQACKLMEKCWDNALVAMDRVLERDLISIEAYLDDRVYREIRDQVLQKLIQPTKTMMTVTTMTNVSSTLIIDHFVTTYTQLRENFVTLVLDRRLNSQFVDFNPRDQVFHLIERTRLLMVVERKEFSTIFDYDYSSINEEITCTLNSQLNRILETVGNLLFQRIEKPCRSLKPEESTELTEFIYPLMNSILVEDNLRDPFGLFLKLLTQRFFPLDNTNKGFNV